MEKLKPLFPFLFLILIAVPLVVWLYPSANPNGAIRLEADSEEIVSLSQRLLDSLRIAHQDFRPIVDLRVDKDLVRQTQSELGLERSNDLLRTSIPGYFWEVRWMSGGAAIRGSGGRNDAEKTLDMLKGVVTMRLTGSGKVLSLSRRFADSLAAESISLSQARAMARTFVREYWVLSGGHDPGPPSSERTLTMPFRTDHEFVWNTTCPPLTNPVKLTVLVSGNTLAKVEPEFNVPSEYTKQRFEDAIGIVVVVLSAAVILMLVILAFKRFRSFEIGFRLAIVIGVLCAMWVALEVFLSAGAVETGWELWLSLIFGAVFVGGAVVLIWAACESIGREVWNEKFVSLDLILKGHFVHSHVGASVIRGISLGLVALALWLILVSAASTMMNVRISPGGENFLRVFTVPTSSLLILAHTFYACVFVFALFVLFGLSYLRRFFSSPVILISLCALVIAIVRQGGFFPLSAGIVLYALVGAIFIWSLYRYDVLAAFLTLFTMTAAQEAYALFLVGHPTYEMSGIVTASFFGLLLLVSAGVQFRRNEITDFESIAPVFARHITERQRLQQELEIARQVQMSFLPKSDPKIHGLDIASRCVPALEVGGDYYDFVIHSPKELGVAVGDVSGKGTQAAFYMTLAKGFLRALSNPTGSVSEVLTQINKLFYDNVERGAFISMVYAIFDMGKKKLRLTRAGHNPVLVWRAKTQKLEVIQPNGLALGLEDGKKFSKTIEEVKIAFGKGDCFIFYTDGFTEAMNKKMEEYGDERFAATVQNYVGRSSKEILEGIIGDVRVYIGKAKQHDDMTLVVVKIT